MFLYLGVVYLFAADIFLFKTKIGAIEVSGALLIMVVTIATAYLRLRNDTRKVTPKLMRR